PSRAAGQPGQHRPVGPGGARRPDSRHAGRRDGGCLPCLPPTPACLAAAGRGQGARASGRTHTRTRGRASIMGTRAGGRNRMSPTLPFRTYLYFLAQSINLTAAVMSVAMAAIVGATLTPSLWLSTVPYGVQFLFMMLMTVPASRLMQRIGRKPAF